MNIFASTFYALLLYLLLCPLAFSADDQPTYSYVLVHGATGGGWDWKAVDNALSKNQHIVYRPTLTGLGEKAHLASAEVSLSTHIDDIVNLILFENLQQVVLVGHSYGGMVITGVMDRIPERLSHVIFLDAAVPADGMSAIDVYGPLPPNSTVKNGLIYFSWINEQAPYPRDVPQPHKTFTEAVSFKNPKAQGLPASFVAFVSEEERMKRRKSDVSWQRAEQRGWAIYTLDSDHNAQRSRPKALAEMLESIPGNKAAFDKNKP